MARVLFPKLLPGFCITPSPTHSPGGTVYQTIVTLKELLEIYWRVKRWRVSVEVPTQISYEVVNWLDPNNPPPASETQLVCGYIVDLGEGPQSIIGCNLSFNSGFFGVFGGFFNTDFFVTNPAVYSISDNIYYMGIYLEISAATIEPYQVYFGASYGGGDVGGAKYQIPLVLSNSTVMIPMYYNAAEDQLPLPTFKIEAIEWWPYIDSNGVALYDAQTGLPL
jgi:hypothetical protein